MLIVRYVQSFFGYLFLDSFAISGKRKVRFAAELCLWFLLVYYQHELAAFADTPRLIQVGLVFLTTHIATTFLRFFIVTSYRRRNLIAIGEQDNFLLSLEALVLLFTILVSIGSLFPIYQIPFKEFLTSISVFSVAIVWGFHQYITNFLDGLRLMFSSDFKIGDYVKIADKASGIITDVNFRATRLRTDDGDVVFVPNTTILNSEVTNFSKVKYKRIVVTFTLAKATAPSYSLIETELQGAVLKEFSHITRPEKINLIVKDITRQSIVYDFEVSVGNYSFAIEDDLKKCVYLKVLTLEHS